MTAADERASKAKRLPLRTKLLFGCGQGVEASASLLANTFLLFFLTNIAGFAPSLSGTIIFLSLVVDAVADPLIGSWSDRTRSRWGRRLPFMVVGLPLMCLAALALFSIPLPSSMVAAIAIALLLNISLRVGTSLYALPYSALTAELTDDYRERSSVALYRMLFGFIGMLATIGPAFGLVFTSQAAFASRGSYVSLGILLSAVVLVLGSVCMLAARSSIRADRAEHRLLLPASTKPFMGNVRDLLRNPSFVWLFLSALLILVIGGSVNALNLYAYTYFWKLPAAMNQLPILAFQGGLLVGIPVSAWMLDRMEKRDAVLAALLAVVVTQILPIACALLFFRDLPDPRATTLLAIATGVFGAANSLFFIGFQSMVADAVDEHEEKFGQRCEALYYSALIFSAKAAVGIGSLIAGLVLTIVGMKSGGVEASVAPIGPDAARLLGLLWGPAHGLAFLLSVPLLLRYRLNRERHHLVLHGLERLRVLRDLPPSDGSPLAPAGTRAA